MEDNMESIKDKTTKNITEPEKLDDKTESVRVLGIKPIPVEYSATEELELTAFSEVDTSGDEAEVSNLINNESDSSNKPNGNGPELLKTLNLFNAVTFIVGDIVGSGIFITPTSALRYSGSFGMVLIFWVIGGILSIGGGLVYVELGSLIKDSGADYAYLRDAYSFGGKTALLRGLGNLFGFVSVWSSCFLIRPLSLSVLSQAFALYLCQAISAGATPPKMAIKLMATSAILLIGLINMLSVKLTSILIDILTVTKVLALVFIMVLGLWQLIAGVHLDNFRNAFEGTSSDPGDIALAFYSILYAYSGWNALGYIVEESKNPEKNIFRGLLIAMPIVTVCYVLVNVAYFAGLSKEELLSSPATALTFAENVLGKAGLVIIPLLVACSTFGASLFSMFAGPRTTFSAARDGNLPGALALLQNTSKTPVPAVVAQALVSIIFVFGGSIGQLVNGVGVAEWIQYALVFAGCIILRYTRKHDKRPFKVWIIVPIVMILVSIFLVLVPLILVPSERVISSVVIFIMLIGIPCYLVCGLDRLRPKFISKLSDMLTNGLALLLDSTSAQTTKSDIQN